jgi:hypothetical protein
MPVRSSSTSSHTPIAADSGAVAAIAAAACIAPRGDRNSMSWPPSTAVAMIATLNQSHCCVTNAPLARWRWPFSTSSAPQSVLAIAIAKEVRVSANTSRVGASASVTQP